MEHESFENEAVAAVLNEHFVAIKVDREERPDIDRVYMNFVQATTGSGGWPMSVWLTPELKPFYGGTYFPPSSKWGRPGFTEMLEQIAQVWRGERAKVAQSAESLTAQLRATERSAATDMVPGADALHRAVQQFVAAFDGRYGGFSDSPKFPRPSELLFLLREHARTGSPQALEMTLRTLRSMALGGMRDHIGGGFHRYSVDAAWRVPHFEKMLYDQAQLVLAYVEAGQASGDPFYLEVAEDTLLYVLREMTDPDGGFYCAEDADSVPPEQGTGLRTVRGAPSPIRRKARSICGAPTKSTRCSEKMRPSSSSASGSSRAAMRRPIRSRNSPARTFSMWRDRSTSWRPSREKRPTKSSTSSTAAASRCSSIGSSVRGRTGTTRFSRSGTV